MHSGGVYLLLNLENHYTPRGMVRLLHRFAEDEITVDQVRIIIIILRFQNTTVALWLYSAKALNHIY
jgi:hypothetical protein